jgi:hypothetical protein
MRSCRWAGRVRCSAVSDDAEFTVSELPLLPGDQLLLYTDGVTDARGRSERFGEERLIEALRALDPRVTGVAERFSRPSIGSSPQHNPTTSR